MAVIFNDNSQKVLIELEQRKRAALEACGQQGASYAKAIVTAAGRIDTDTMRGSISHQTTGDSVDIGTNVSYAIYHEMGTGIYIAGGRKSPWAYKDAKGEWHWTRGVPPIHMIKNAVANHVNTFKQIILRILRE